MSMLINRQDTIVNAYESFYKDFQHLKLLVFCIKNHNEIYLKYALQKAIYGASELCNPDVIDAITDQLHLKAKTEFILNILIFADFGRWGQEKLSELVEFFDNMTDPAYEQNRIVLSYNPILTICLACQILTSIGNAVSLFKH